MFRRLLTVITVISFLLFVATLGTCVATHWFCFSLVRVIEPSLVRADVLRGDVDISVTRRPSDLGYDKQLGPFLTGINRLDTVPDGIDLPDWIWRFPHLGYTSGTHKGIYSPEKTYELVFPYWFLPLITAVLPAWRIRNFLQRRKWQRTGRCHRCGYDLRASIDRCPECGTAHFAASTASG